MSNEIQSTRPAEMSRPQVPTETNPSHGQDQGHKQSPGTPDSPSHRSDHDHPKQGDPLTHDRSETQQHDDVLDPLQIVEDAKNAIGRNQIPVGVLSGSGGDTEPQTQPDAPSDHTTTAPKPNNTTNFLTAYLATQNAGDVAGAFVVADASGDSGGTGDTGVPPGDSTRQAAGSATVLSGATAAESVGGQGTSDRQQPVAPYDVTGERIQADPDLRSYLQDMNLSELHDYLGQANLDGEARAYLAARLERLEANEKIRECARTLLGRCEGTRPVLVVGNEVRKQLQEAANGTVPGTQEIRVHSGHKEVVLGPEAARHLETLVALTDKIRERHEKKSGSTEQMEIVSWVRPNQGLHGFGSASDIGRYGGFSFDERKPKEANDAAKALVRDLPTGHYGFGVPRLPSKVVPHPPDWKENMSPEETRKYERDLKQYQGEAQQHGKDMITRPDAYPKDPHHGQRSPILRDATPEARNRPDPFFEQGAPVRFGDNIAQIKDDGLRALLRDRADHDTQITPFPDGFRHGHLSTVSREAKGF